MVTQPDWIFFLSAFFSLLGMIVSVILFITNRIASFSPRILAAIIFSVSFTLLNYGLFFSHLYISWPFLWRSPVFFTVCMPPLIFIYVRSILNQEFKFQKWDFLFLIPAILYTLQFIPVYLMPEQEKLIVIKKALNDRLVYAREEDAMLPPGLGIMFRLVYGLCMVSGSFILLIKRRKSIHKSTIEQNKEIYHWLIYFTIIMSATYLILIIEYIFQISRYIDIYRLIITTVSLTVLFICFYLLIKPNILYGLKGWLQEPEPIIIKEGILDAEKPFQESKKITLTREQGFLYRQAIEKHFQDSKPYLKPGYTIRDLSVELNIPAYLLSSFINQEYGKNFNELINDERVDYLEAVIKKSPDHFQFTLEALGQKAGFKSRTAFISAVKKKTGKTPSELFGRGGGELQ